MCAAAAASIGIGVGASQQRRRLTTTSKMVTTADALTPYDAVTHYNNFYEYGEDKDDPARYANAFTAAPWTVAKRAGMVTSAETKPSTRRGRPWGGPARLSNVRRGAARRGACHG